MKDLKYIKLFEAFESVKLSKTLGFIDKRSRASFIEDIKSICRSHDFPVSKISDDLFEYLPFKKALEYHQDIEELPCTATSESEYNSSIAIPGEKCENGKLKRTWGAGRVRVMTCPHCDGSGIEPFRAKWKYVKFWFSVDKKYITKTATDGNTHDDDDSPYKYDQIITISYGISRTWREDIKDGLKSANFALILDIDKLESLSKETPKASEISDNRDDARSGALALEKDNVIKQRNIERYLEEILKKSNIKGDLSDLKDITKTFLRLIGGNNILFYICYSTNTDGLDRLSRIADNIYDIMSSPNDFRDLEYTINDVNSDIHRYIRNANNFKQRIKISLDSTKQYVEEQSKTGEKDNRPVQLFNNIMEINNLIYKYVSTSKIETLYDYEVLLSELNSIQNLIRERRYGFDNIRQFMEKVSSRWSYEDAKHYITKDRCSNATIDNAIVGTDRLKIYLKTKYSL
jgi:hypothetical protein